ncbi:hypothetical protein HID58_025953 [Brassica napus]|uniref:SKP1-like protein n=1 Tax=Brassica napus TaxID=3708 RepID=A0ABQ8CP00_BRANA|nr:hypothetical protein HID58_025953 [Brassica napus]
MESLTISTNSPTFVFIHHFPLYLFEYSATMSKKITLKSSDGVSFQVDEAVALMSPRIKRMIEDDRTGNGITIPNVNSAALAKVIEYCKKHVEANADDTELKAWDLDFARALEGLDKDAFFAVASAAHSLNIGGLFDLTCKSVAEMVSGKTVDQIRDIFHIKNDYTDAEEAKMRKENAWAFDSEGESFEVDEAVALECQTIKNMIEDDCTDGGIPLANVNSATLSKVIDYCKKHVEAAAAAGANAGDKDIYGANEDIELKTWDEDFVKVDQPLLFDLMLAANFLNIPGLLDLTTKTVADMMRGKTVLQIREIFHIKKDYTDAEEAEKIIFESSEGESFEVDEAVALECQTIKNMIEDDCTDGGIPLANVNSATLTKVIDYCKKHVEAAAAAEANAGDKDIYGANKDIELKTWDEEFVKVDQPLLFDLMLAANFLIIPGLLDLTCKTMMRGKTVLQIREIFHIKKDYTDAEEAEVRKENAWAFEYVSLAALYRTSKALWYTGLHEGFSDLRRAAIPETWGHDIEVPDSMLTSGGSLPCGAAFKSPISHDASMLTPGAAISGCNRKVAL